MSTSETEHIVSEASAFINEGEFDKAIARLDLALQKDETNARLLYMKGCAHAEFGQLEDAIAAYESSAEHAGEMAINPLYNLANLYKERDDFPNAVITFNKVLQLDPSMCDAWINLGCILDDHKQHATALDCYDAALQSDSEDPLTWSNRGNSLRALDRLEEAETSYRKALELDEDNIASAVGLGGSMVERGDVEGLALLDETYESTQHPKATPGVQALIALSLENG
jgi:tetratricopeptide (TPR) repeat protein